MSMKGGGGEEEEDLQQRAADFAGAIGSKDAE
jgi:hypothetical protein